jgi:hypothetical protein
MSTDRLGSSGHRYAPDEHLPQGAIRLAVLEFLRVRELGGDCELPDAWWAGIQTWRFMNPSVLTRKPLYSSPHFRRTNTGLPVSSCMNGLGLTGFTWAEHERNTASQRAHRRSPWWTAEESHVPPKTETCDAKLTLQLSLVDSHV